MISLYRGELHRVSDVPRQWTVPKSQIPLAVFKNALKKRHIALRRLLSPTSPVEQSLVALLYINGSEASGIPAIGSSELERHCGPEIDRVMGPENSGQKMDGIDDAESRQDRKRKREEDTKDDSRRRMEAKDGNFRTDKDLEEDFRGLSKFSQEKAELMVIDSVYNRGMDEIMAMECDEPSSKLVRVSASEEICAEIGSQSGPGTKPMSEELYGEVVSSAPSGIISHLAVSSADLGSGKEASDIAKSPGMLGERECQQKRRDELEALLKLLTSEKHCLVLMLKQVLSNEEESKKRASSSSAPQYVPPGIAGLFDSTVVATYAEKSSRGETSFHVDLEEGELECVRTPSPPVGLNLNAHGTHGSSSFTILRPAQGPVLGRLSGFPQHVSQGKLDRGHYMQGPAIATPAAAAAAAAGPLSPGGGFIGSMPVPLASQHLSGLHTPKATGNGNGTGHAHAGASSGVTGRPPGFSGYAMAPPPLSHHSHSSISLSQSSTHFSAQPSQGLMSSPLLSTPRGTPGHHDGRTGISGWSQR